jgi:hypothetical protein
MVGNTCSLSYITVLYPQQKAWQSNHQSKHQHSSNYIPDCIDKVAWAIRKAVRSAPEKQIGPVKGGVGSSR